MGRDDLGIENHEVVGPFPLVLGVGEEIVHGKGVVGLDAQVSEVEVDPRGLTWPGSKLTTTTTVSPSHPGEPPATVPGAGRDLEYTRICSLSLP